VLTVSKQKDGEDGLRFGFEMVEIDIEDEGKPSLSLDETRKSLAVQPSDEALQSRMSEAKKEALNRHGKGRNQAIAVDALVEAINTKGTHWKVSVGTRKCVKLAQWKVVFAQKMGTDEDGDDAFRMAWRRVRSDKGRPSSVRIENDWVWIEEPPKSEKQDF
jgi:hypothetical protein